MQDIYQTLVNLLNNIHLFRRLLLQKEITCKNVYVRQLPILNYIILHDGCTQVEIARALYVSPASIALSTKRLQKGGFLKKEADRKSLRRNVLTITKKGKEAADACKATFQKINEKMFEGFTREELESFQQYTDRVLYNLSGDEGRKVDPIARMALINQIKQKHNGKDKTEGKNV